LSLSKISRRTDKGIPQYDDSVDVFVADAEELVPKAANKSSAEVWKYLPRVEGDFSSFQYHRKPGEKAYWKVVTAANETFVYGQSAAARIEDAKGHVFEWLIESAEDAKGNKIQYTYTKDDNDNLPEKEGRNRHDYYKRYISKVEYGNYKDQNGVTHYAFSLLFNYGEYDLSQLNDKDFFDTKHRKPCKYRDDSFSSFKSGFEVRTCRLCEGILLVHNFTNEVFSEPSLVKQLKFDYGKTKFTGSAVLQAATLVGYRKMGDHYLKKSVPPVKFQYSKFDLPSGLGFKKLSIGEQSDIPGYLDASGFQPVDLNGEGIAGFLYNDGTSILYFAPLGGGKYDKPVPVKEFPMNSDMQDGKASLLDLEGNGMLKLVVNNDTTSGYYPRQVNSWGQFQPFEQYPTDITHPAMEMAELNSDGKTDAVLVTRDHVIRYPSEGTSGFRKSHLVDRGEDFPLVKEGYQQEYVGFGNLLGDGLSHRVRIDRDSVSCWPSLGRGRFGEKITFDNPPKFEVNFDASRLFLADIDGSGFLDIVYVHSEKIDVYLNQSGNAFSNVMRISLPEKFTAIDRISFADILGNGASCMVFTKIAPKPKHYYLSFIGEIFIEGKLQPTMKPYLLSEIDNGMGAITRLQYGSSAQFYLKDKAAGNAWHSRLPFPVQVLEKIISIDQIANTCLTREFCYHDGYYDHEEKEFRGFGYVESWDAEKREKLSVNDHDAALKSDAFPVYTRTWHYTGAVHKGKANPYREAKLGAYYSGDTAAYKFPDIVLDASILKADAQTLREAYAALKGTVMRSEVYGEDGTCAATHPYTVNESNVQIKLLQPKDKNEHAVFMVLPRESITYHYERNPLDPRIEQTFTIQTDHFGNVLQTCTVSLPRRTPQQVFRIYPEQQETHVSLSWNTYVNPLYDHLFCHEICEQQTLEVFNLTKKQEYFSFDEVKNQIEQLHLGKRDLI
ncbi:MAG: SpvB/TcaC N-terminal domain-containing protein, partial [Bacteroidota bacterium]